jgi:hypothetical protein
MIREPALVNVDVHADHVAAAVVVVAGRGVVVGVSARGGPVSVVGATVVDDDGAARTTRFALDADREAAAYAATLTVTAQASSTAKATPVATLTLLVPAR